MPFWFATAVIHLFMCWLHVASLNNYAFINSNCYGLSFSLIKGNLWSYVCICRNSWSCTSSNWATAYDFQQCGILISVDSDEPVQPPFKLRNSKWCLVSSLILIEYSTDKQMLWSDCAYAQADLRLCLSHTPHCWKYLASAQLVVDAYLSISGQLSVVTWFRLWILLACVILTYLVLFDFDSLRPINNLSVIKERVFLGWTSSKLWLIFLLKDTTQWRRWGSNPLTLGLESSTLLLSHCAPYYMFDTVGFVPFKH